MTKPKLLVLAVGIAVGYVLGARAGREQYDAMKKSALTLWENPRVSKARKDVEAYARAQAPIIRERAEAVAKDVTEKATATAKDVTDKATATAKDVTEKAGTAAKDVRTQAGKVASDLRERGEAAVDSAVATAGKAREDALDVLDDEDDRPSS
jgi:cell division septum initiation protein DivIVA